MMLPSAYHPILGSDSSETFTEGAKPRAARGPASRSTLSQLDRCGPRAQSWPLGDLPGARHLLRFVFVFVWRHRVLVTKLDRLGRSTRELLDLIHRIDQAGASFKSLGDPLFDTSSSQGRLLVTML